MLQRHSVFYLGDEQAVFDFFRGLFSDDSDVRVTSEAAEARRSLAECSADIIFSEQEGQEAEGAQFLREAARLCPDSFRVLVTGTHGPAYLLDEIGSGVIHALLPKPWAEEDVQQVLLRAEIALNAPSRRREGERRVAPRLEARLGVRVLMIAERGTEGGIQEVLALSGCTRDISESGLALIVSEEEADEVFSLGQECALRLTLPLPAGTVELTARPMRRAAHGAGQCVIGAQITDMSGRDRVVFMNYLRELAVGAARR